jgi:CheY-like chemotaxis protein
LAFIPEITFTGAKVAPDRLCPRARGGIDWLAFPRNQFLARDLAHRRLPPAGSVRAVGGTFMGDRDRESEQPRTAAKAAERSVMVLIVGVERSVRAVTQRMLERRGFRTLEASGGGEALALFRGREGEIAGVVLDLGMPGMDAEAIFSELRCVRTDLPVLFTGGYGEDTVVTHLAGAAGTDFLPKPFGLDALGAKAGDLFGSGRRSPPFPLSGPAATLHETPA